MQFYPNMLRTRAKLIRIIGEFKATSVVLIDRRLMQPSFNMRLVTKKLEVGYSCEVETFRKFQEQRSHGKKIAETGRQGYVLGLSGTEGDLGLEFANPVDGTSAIKDNVTSPRYS